MHLSNLEISEFEKYLNRFNFNEYIKNKTILITGAKGIIGWGGARILLYGNLKHGNNTKIIASTREPEVLPDYIAPSDNVKFIKFGDELKITDKIDYIIHAASPTSNKVFKAQPVECLKTIFNGTERILELAKKNNATVIYLSSEEAYGITNLKDPVNEKYYGAVESLNTRSVYPLGKKSCELLCRSYYEEYGLDVKIIRPTVILGLYQPYNSVKVECEMMRCIAENKNLFMKSDGLTKKSVIYSLDAINAVFTVLFKGKAGEAYNATNPATYSTVKDRALKMFERFNPDLKIEFAKQDNSQALGYLPKRELLEDINKISELGWRPFVDDVEIFEIDLKRFGFIK